MSTSAFATRIEVRLTDALKMEPAAMTVPDGVPVTFVVTNGDAADHKFYLGDEAAQSEHEKEMGAMGGMTHDEPDRIRLKRGEIKELTHLYSQRDGPCRLPRGRSPRCRDGGRDHGRGWRMNVATLAGVLRERARPRTHDGWTRDEILAYQARRLADVRAFATAHSPFYRDVHRGLEGASLSSLPVVTKATLMERFDDPVTDRDVRLADVELMGFGDLTDAGIVRRLGAFGSFGS